MTKQMKLYLWIMLIDLLSITMGNIFINVFLMRIADDFANVLLFNAGSFAFIMVAAIILGPLSKHTSKKIGIIIGNMSSIFMYVLVIILQEDVNGIIWLLAILSGLSQGFYWLSMNTLLLDLCDKKYRQKLNAWNGAVNSLCQLSGPLLASFIVALFPLMQGYQMLFSVISILMAISIILSFFIKPKPSSQPYSLRSVMRLPNFSKYRKSCVFTAELFYRDGAIASLLNILIFKVVQSEVLLSTYLSYMMLLMMLVYLGITKIRMSRHRLFYCGTCFCGIAMMLLCIGLNNQFLIFSFVTLFGIGSPICTYQMILHAQTITYHVDTSNAYSLEFTIIKEIATGIGRISACIILYVLYIWTYDFQFYWIFAISAIGICLASVKTYRKVIRGEQHG